MPKRHRDSAPTSTEKSEKSSFKYANLHTEEEASEEAKPQRKYKRHDQKILPTSEDDSTSTGAKVSSNFLGEDERPYLAAIKVDLAQAVQNKEHLSEKTVENEDDISSYEVIWDRIRGREVLIAKDKELSFILEYLMRLTGLSGISKAVSLFVHLCEETPSLLQDLICHSCASHIIEEIFERIAVLPDQDIPLLDRFLDFLLLTPSVFVDNQYAAHVAEKMLLRLCRIVNYRMEDGKMIFVVFDPAAGATKEFLYNKDDPAKLAELFGRVISGRHRKLLKKVIGLLQGLMESPEVGGLHGQIWTSASGSVVTQALLTALLVSHTETPSTGKKSSSTDTPRSIDLFEKLAQKFRILAMNKYGSRCAELLIALAPSAIYLQLINTVCSDAFHMDEIIQDNNAHHVLIRLVEFCSDIPLLLLLTKTLCEKIMAILSSGHGMILVGLTKKLADGEVKKALCGRHGSASEWGQCQTTVVAALKGVYTEHGPQGWTDEQKRDYFVVVVGALYHKNFRKDPKVTAQNICMPGSQIIQSLCLFKENAAVNNSFLKLDKDLLLEYCTNTCGSYAIEKLLATQKGQKNFYQPFLQKLSTVAPELVMTKCGSRVFDFLWKTVDAKSREAFIEQLLPMEAKLRTNEYARFLLVKLNFGLFRRSVEAWRDQQAVYEKQKSDLRDILEMTSKKRAL